MLGSGWLGQVQVLLEYFIRIRRGFRSGATEGGSLSSLIGSREGRPRKSAEGLCPSDPGARCTELLLRPCFDSARPGAGGGFRVSGATGQQGGEDLTQIDLQQKVLKSGDELN